jgi:glycine oxidase
LHSALRVLHHRYPLYLVPRDSHQILIGATAIESEDDGPVAVKSVLELLAPIFRLHPALRYAKLRGQSTGVRPAFPDHLPRVDVSTGLIRVNGLYRHGFLLAPALAETVEAAWRKLTPRFPEIVHGPHVRGRYDGPE